MLEVDVIGAALPEAQVVQACALAAASAGVAEAHVAVEFVDAERIAELNLAHRGKGVATDVLSFPLDGHDSLPDGLPRQLGDVVVCPSFAAARGTPIETLLVHGALHLAGYDHEGDAGEMLERQELLLREVGPVAAEPA
jgi:probable rRNA maturation factor